MKKYVLFSFIGAAMVLLVSCGQKSPTAQTLSYQDAVEFAQFQEWKAMQAQQEMQMYAANTNAPRAARRYSAPAKTVRMNSSSTHEAKAPARKKWSKAAKYGVIGGGGGAVIGAVINKRNRVAGGVVGAVLGGGLGYVLGRSQDKKEGRY
ncbi:MAG TPA: glycine zipper domain-containing protein [Chitinophagaceae bacterium]|nr:glycine zipper domain-containing protein [Chitinophagaceae bacterium]